MKAAEFLSGYLLVAITLFSVWLTASRLRQRLLPGYTGPPGWLVEIVTAVGLLVVVSELLGIFGLIRPLVLTGVLALIALIAWARLSPRTPGPRDPVVVFGTVGFGAQVVVILVIFALVSQWGAFTSYNLDHGISNFDSVWYHMPFAAEIAKTGSVTGFHHTETVFVNWFYPQNSELLHGIAMVMTGRDFISIFMNMGWLAVGLLAGWCVGRPYGRPHLTMLGVAVLMATHTLVVREPGTGKNDVMALALVVASVAILTNRSSARLDRMGRYSPDWSIAAAGLAAGLAAGTKVTALAPALLISIAAIYSAFPGTRWKATWIWFSSLALGGGWWYLRNLIATGNPLPQITSIGSVGLPGPERLQIGRPDFSVAHYLVNTEVWKKYFVPGLEQGFGHVWPILLLLVLAGTALVVWTGPGRLTRSHSLMALLAIGAYLITPLGAAGPEGDPTAFAINLRFLIPALGMAVVMIPLAKIFERGWERVALGVLLIALFVGTSASDPFVTAPGKEFGILIALIFIGIPGAAWLARERLSRLTLGRPPLAAAFACSMVVFLLLSWPIQRSYFDNRYEDFEPDSGLAAPYRWAQETKDSKIAIAGTTAGFKQFGFYGKDLSNDVTYIGKDAASGGFDAIGTCEGFIRALNGADPDYLVTSPFLNFDDYEHPQRSPETYWALKDPNLTPIVVGKSRTSKLKVVVWRVDGPSDPAYCSALGPEADYIPGLKQDS